MKRKMTLFARELKRGCRGERGESAALAELAGPQELLIGHEAGKGERAESAPALPRRSRRVINRAALLVSIDIDEFVQGEKDVTEILNSLSLL